MNETKRLPVGCVVMAAGNAARFGENKLASVLDGKTMIERALEAVPTDELDRVCVVTQYAEVEALARRFGFLCLRNDRPEEGVSRTVRLGTEALGPHCRAIIYQVADQPFLRRESVAALARAWRAAPECIVGLAHGGVRGHPCVFPERFFPELCALTGDRGGSAVIRRHAEALRLIEVDARELLDVDTAEELRKLNG